MGQVVVVGLDIAKSVFQVHGIGQPSRPVRAVGCRGSEADPFYAPWRADGLRGFRWTCLAGCMRLLPI